MLSVTNKPFMLSVVMLNVIMLSDILLKRDSSKGKQTKFYNKREDYFLISILLAQCYKTFFLHNLQIFVIS
jgi:hypothetical protein